MRECVAQLVIALDYPDAQTAEQFWREYSRGAVASGTNHLERAGSFRNPLQGQPGRHRAGLALFVQYNIVQFANLVGAVGKGTLKTHLHAGPAVGAVARCDHRKRNQLELRKIDHRQQRGTYVFDIDTRPHQAQHQRILNRLEILPARIILAKACKGIITSRRSFHMLRVTVKLWQRHDPVTFKHQHKYIPS